MRLQSTFTSTRLIFFVRVIVPAPNTADIISLLNFRVAVLYAYSLCMFIRLCNVHCACSLCILHVRCAFGIFIMRCKLCIVIFIVHVLREC